MAYSLLNTTRCVFLLTLLTLTASVTINHINRITPDSFKSVFKTSYIAAGSELTVVVKPQTTGSYDIVLWRPEGDSNNFQRAGTFTGTKMFVSNALDSSGNWRVEIVPMSSNPFLINLDFQVSGATINSFVGIASKKRIFTLYHTNINSYNINVNVYAGDMADLTTTLYGPFASLSFVGGSAQQVPKVSNNAASMTYTGAANSYYYIVVEAAQALLNLKPLYSISFQTDRYQCPYTSSLTDSLSYFTGCSTILPTRGWPCLSFDSQLDRCINCQTPYKVTDKGVCIQENGCSENQYIKFGNCYDPIVRCNSFDKFGGQCFSCEEGYNLVNSTQQKCQAIAPVCTQDQYLVDNVCKQKVKYCVQFISLTGICQACEPTYNLVDNVCHPKEANVNCPNGQAKYNGICKRVDPKCVFVDDVSGDCLLCAKGYQWLDQACQWIQCADRQYNGLGVCIDISPACGEEYDKVTGDCLSCKNPELFVLNNQGKCIQIILNAQEVKTTSCQDRYVLKGDTCVQVDSLCNGYDKTSGDCTSCNSPNTYFLNSGKCILIDGYCRNQPGTFFSNGQCVPVNGRCDNFNSNNGRCITCIANTFLNQTDGKCYYNEQCSQADRQYKKADGSCGVVDSKCSTWQTDGTCTNCSSGYELNNPGVCCLQFNYLADPLCKPYHKENCQLLDRLDFCQECKSGYAKSKDAFGEDYYYSKCKAI